MCDSGGTWRREYAGRLVDRAFLSEEGGAGIIQPRSQTEEFGDEDERFAGAVPTVVLLERRAQHPKSVSMDTFDFDKEFSEWVVIRDQVATPFAPAPSEEGPLTSPVPTRVPIAPKDLYGPSGDVIFSLPEHIILSVLRYSSTDPYALYRYVFSSSAR